MVGRIMQCRGEYKKKGDRGAARGRRRAFELSWVPTENVGRKRQTGIYDTMMNLILVKEAQERLGVTTASGAKVIVVVGDY